MTHHALAAVVPGSRALRLLVAAATALALCFVDALAAQCRLDDVIPDVDAVPVEVFARWLHARLSDALSPLPGATLAVRIWENEVAFGGHTAPL